MRVKNGIYKYADLSYYPEMMESYIRIMRSKMRFINMSDLSYYSEMKFISNRHRKCNVESYIRIMRVKNEIYIYVGSQLLSGNEIYK